MPLYVLGALTDVEEDDDTDDDRFPLDETRFKSSTMGAGVLAGAAEDEEDEDSVVVDDDGVDLHSVCTWEVTSGLSLDENQKLAPLSITFFLVVWCACVDDDDDVSFLLDEDEDEGPDEKML